MLHLIFEGNQDLNNRTFPLAKGIKKHLRNTLDNYTGDKTVDGYKRLNNVLEMDSISYHEMKRIKNFFDNYKGTPKSTEFILNGGEPMMNWVNNTLNTATKAVRDFKQAKKDAGINNAFIKPHEKQRQIRKDKPTQAKIQTDDVAKKIGDNNAIRFENKEKKVIYITEKVYRELLSENKYYNVNLDIEPAKQGRTASKISPKEFENKLRELYEKYENDRRFTIGNFVYSLCRPHVEVPELSELHKDIQKVKFDFENCDAIGNEVRETNGICYIMARAGGDWECPVLFFVYWDGSKFRGYVPIYGNAVNRKTNAAFQGSGCDEDKEFLKTQNIPDEELDSAVSNISYNKNACLKDFKSRVKNCSLKI